jgi:hypothetical protein
MRNIRIRGITLGQAGASEWEGWATTRPERLLNHDEMSDTWENRSMAAQPSIAEVEACLAKAVRDYLLAERNDRISEDECLRSVCKWLSRWLRDMLPSERVWGPYRSVDDILPCTSDRRSGIELELTGLLIWMSDGSREWKEPLSAAIHVSGPSMQCRGKVSVGDADRGLGKCPYDMSHDYPAVPVHRWLFTFVLPDPDGGQC